MPDMEAALSELRRVLRLGGTAQIMVYHRDSIWTHLYVAYQRQLVEGLDAELDLAAAFQRSTDGPDCPISRCFSCDEFADIAARHGFALERFGAAVSAWEMSLLHQRHHAIMDPRMPDESRDFLAALTFDNQGLPIGPSGIYAGIDGCFRFKAV
jgi:hypothetical protein